MKLFGSSFLSKQPGGKIRARQQVAQPEIFPQHTFLHHFSRVRIWFSARSLNSLKVTRLKTRSLFLARFGLRSSRDESQLSTALLIVQVRRRLAHENELYLLDRNGQRCVPDRPWEFRCQCHVP